MATYLKQCQWLGSERISEARKHSLSCIVRVSERWGWWSGLKGVWGFREGRLSCLPNSGFSREKLREAERQQGQQQVCSRERIRHPKQERQGGSGLPLPGQLALTSSLCKVTVPPRILEILPLSARPAFCKSWFISYQPNSSVQAAELSSSLDSTQDPGPWTAS